MDDQPIARPQTKQDNTNTELNQIFIDQAGFKPTNPVSKPLKTSCASENVTTVLDKMYCSEDTSKCH
jgi:hypothetical protein